MKKLFLAMAFVVGGLITASAQVTPQTGTDTTNIGTMTPQQQRDRDLNNGTNTTTNGTLNNGTNMNNGTMDNNGMNNTGTKNPDIDTARTDGSRDAMKGTKKSKKKAR